MKMQNSATPISSPHQLHRKRRGEVAEAAFLHKATSLGFTVAKTWGESDRYDFMVDTARRLLRVQVKSAYSPGPYGGYTFHARGCSLDSTYTADEIDFLIIYIAPIESWYIFPIAYFANRHTIKIFPNGRHTSPAEPYREAWHLMTEEPPTDLST